MIKVDIEMPKYCENCYFAYRLVVNKRLKCAVNYNIVSDGLTLEATERPDNCPLVESEEGDGE